jgi:hypothetical protein
MRNVSFGAYLPHALTSNVGNISTMYLLSTQYTRSDDKASLSNSHPDSGAAIAAAGFPYGPKIKTSKKLLKRCKALHP